MKKLREHISNNLILYRMISGYTIMCTVIILLMTTAMYSIFSKELKDVIYRFHEQTLQQVANTVSFRAEYANQLMLQVQQGRETSRLFYMTDMQTAYTAINRMEDLRSKVKQLHSIYVYNENAGNIYCSGDTQFLPYVSPADEFGDAGFIDILNNIGQYSKYTPYIRKISLQSTSGHTYESYVYTYLLFDTYNNSKVKNIVAFNFQLGWMKDALNYITDYKGAEHNIWIVDEEKQVVYSDSMELIGQTMSQDILPDEIYQSTSGYLIQGGSDNKQMLVYATPSHSNYENWTFVSRSDYSVLMAPLNRVRSIIYAICILAFLFSVLVIILVSRTLYVPVRQTMERVESLEEEQLKKQKIDRMLFLRKLFLGNVKDDLQIIKASFKNHGIETDAEADIRIVLITVDYLSSYLRRLENDLEPVDRVMEELIAKYFRKQFSVKMQDGIWAVCIPAEEEDFHADHLFTDMNQYLDQNMGITVSMAVSEIGHSARDIPYLYSEAVDIQSYTFLLGQGRLIQVQDIRDQGQDKFEYPHELEKKIVNNLFGQKGAEAEDAYQEFVDAIKGYTVEEIKLSFMLLAYGIKNASHKTMAETSSILLEFDRFYKKLQAVETIDEVHQMFKHLFGEIADKQKVFSKERHEILIDQIKAYVDQNYGNMSLSMNQVSDHVNMSAAYLGRLFKQVTGITFTEYLTRFRLNIACDLLKNTDKTVNEISDEIGFTNSSYFYIIFKKNLECTPNQYRKQFADQNLEESS